MRVDSTKKNRSNNNPYLMSSLSSETSRTTFGSEFKRLASLPFRLPLTLGLVFLPLALGLAGTLDLLTAWIYTLSHHSLTDPRPTIYALDCVQDKTRKLCNGLVWASTASPKRIVLYPWHGFTFLHQFEPYLFAGFLVIAFLSFVAIGNPRLTRIGQTFGAVLGLGSRRKSSQQSNLQLGLEVKAADKKNKSKNKDKKGKNNNGEPAVKAPWLIPVLEIDSDADPKSLSKVWESSLLLGGYLPRMWESDPGYFYVNLSNQRIPYWLTLNMLRTNLVIVAPQGAGKTSSVYRPLLNFMRRSNSVGIFWDSKGDDFSPDFFDYNFDPADPANSFKLNVFSGKTPVEAGERLGEALVPDLSGDKQYFSNNAKDAIAALTAAHAASFGRNPELFELLDYLNNPPTVQSLHDRMLTMLTGPDQREEGLRLATLLRRVIQLADNKATDVLGSLAGALSPLVTGPIARVLATNPDPGTFTIEELLKKPGLIRLSLPVAKSPRIAPILGRLILAQFTYAVLSPDCNRNIFKMAAVDEARHFITENVANGMAQARSNNAGYVLALQALSQIREESLLDTIFAVSGTKIVMSGVGEKDARRFSDTFGQLELPYVTHSQGRSSGTTRNNGSSSSRGQEYEFFGGQSGRESRASRSSSQGKGMNESRNETSSTITRVRPRFFPAELRELEQFQAVVESSDAQGRRWFAQVIDMRASTVNQLENKVLEQLNRLGAKSKYARKSHHEQAKWQLDRDWMEAATEDEDETSAKPDSTEADVDEKPENFVRPVVKFMPVTVNIPNPNPVPTFTQSNGAGVAVAVAEAEPTSPPTDSAGKETQQAQKASKESVTTPTPDVVLVTQPQRRLLLLPAPALVPVSAETLEPDLTTQVAAPETDVPSKEKEQEQGQEQEEEQAQKEERLWPEVKNVAFVQASFIDFKEDTPVLIKKPVNKGTDQTLENKEFEQPQPYKNVAGEL